MYKSLLFFACCLMALSACEHEIDFDYLTSEPKIIFDGRISNEGVFVRIKRDRRVLINIPGVVAVATTHVHLSMLEKITDPDPNQLDNAL